MRGGTVGAQGGASAPVSGLLAAALLVGCSAPTNYFDFGSSTGRSAPAAAGETVYIGTGGSLVEGDDSVEFVTLTLVDPVPADLAIEPLIHFRRNGPGIGIGPASAVPAEVPIAKFQPLGGTTVANDDDAFSILVRIEMPASDVTFSGVDITFRVNGGAPRTQRIHARVRVCLSTEPTMCPVPQPAS